MTEWRNRVDRLLLDGESVEASVSVGGAEVHVTTTRVLAFLPGDGANVRSVERPNATGARRVTRSERDLVPRAVKVGVVALVLLVAGVAFEPETLLPAPDVGTAGPAEDLLGPVQTMLRLFYGLDEAMLVAGAGVALVALALAGLQVASRREYVVVEVAGDDDLRLPAAGVEDETVRRLDAALKPPGGDRTENGAATADERSVFRS